MTLGVIPKYSLSDEDQIEEEGDYTCINYILDELNRRDRLPHRDENHTLTTEQDLVRSRFYNNARYLTDGGSFREELEPGYLEYLNYLGTRFKGRLHCPLFDLLLTPFSCRFGPEDSKKNPGGHSARRRRARGHR